MNNSKQMKEHNFKVGDVVCPVRDTQLRSGSEWYTYAIVVSEDPLILVSGEADMRWSATVDDMDLMKVGRATDIQLKNCMRRLKD